MSQIYKKNQMLFPLVQKYRTFFLPTFRNPYCKMLYFCKSVFTETFIHFFTTLKSKKWNQLKETKEKRIPKMKKKTGKGCI